jgi:cytochrome c5
MSASHDDAHAPEPVELTSPLLWTVLMLAACATLAWWFFHWLGDGRVEGRRGERIPKAAAAAGEVEPDHQKLIANRGQDVLDLGALVYGKNCASCHGAQGNSNPSNMSPPPRNFQADAFRGPLGGGPYALYTVVSHGLNGMPAFPALTPEQRYAVVHYIRETWVKTANAKNYVDRDPPAVVAQIPPPGKAVEGGERVAPDRIEIKAPVQPLLAAIADDQAQAWNQCAAWLYAARRAAAGKPELAAAVKQLIALFDDQAEAGRVERVRQAVASGDRQAFTALLAGSDGSGEVRPYFSLLAEDQLAALFQFLTSQGGK